MYRTQEEILQDMLNNINNTEDKSEKSFVHDSLAPSSIEFFMTKQDIKTTGQKLDIANLEMGEIDIFVEQGTGIKRRLSTYAFTNVIIEGVEGTEIQMNELVMADKIPFRIVDGGIIDSSGEIELEVVSTVEGSSGNVEAGTINTFPQIMQGLTSVTNPEPTTNGYDEESTTELIDRYYDRVRTPATSGNKYHYRNWALEYIGVGDAKVFPLWDGDNTVKVVIVDSNKQPSDAELVADVQEYIDPGITGLGEGQAPIGAFCTVEAAIKKDITISVQINRVEEITPEDTKENIRARIVEYLKEVTFTGTIISIAKVGSTILYAEGVQDYKNLTINGVVTNIPLGGTDCPILTTLTVEEGV